MKDILTPAEVSAIAAFPAARVQRIPTGVSGLETWQWDAKANTIRSPSGQKWTPWGVKKPKTPKPPATPSRQKRAGDINPRIVSMLGDGASIRSIAADIGITRHAVSQRISKMRARGVAL